MPAPDRMVVYAVSREMLPGPYDGAPPEGHAEAMDFYENAPPAPQFSKREQEQILWRRVVLHATYSLQQSEFRRMGFGVMCDQVMLPEGALLVCIGTRDRYDIFGTPITVHQYESVAEWREGRDAEAEGW